jgi:hypothetical protein
LQVPRGTDNPVRPFVNDGQECPFHEQSVSQLPDVPPFNQRALAGRFPMKVFLTLFLFLAALPGSFALAAIAPLSVDKLQAQADAIVVATISQIEIEPEPSRFEPGFGNSDWAIYLTLSVDAVEKGNVTAEKLVARGFRVRFRRSLVEYFTPSGHHSIPGTGTRVRADLTMEDGRWNIVLPNGLKSAPEGNGQTDGALQDAAQVAQLENQGRAFTFLLPLEVWILMMVAVIPFLVVIRKSKARKRMATAMQCG